MEDYAKQYVKNVQDEYSPHEQTKLDELRKLDIKVKRTPIIVSSLVGLIGAVIHALGWCFALGAIVEILWLGIVFGIAGIGIFASVYFIFMAMYKSRKKKYGNRIMQLSNELLSEQNK